MNTAHDLVDWIRGVAPAAQDLRLDSREVMPGDVFLAVPGRRHDGREHIAAAVERGAAAVLAEGETGSLQVLVGAPVLEVRGLREALGALAAQWYGAPSAGLLSIGVTGTNGKTSCSQWIAQALTRAGRRCAVIGTVGSGFPGEALDAAALTTPDAVSLQRAVRHLAERGAQALAMEVSSIGLEQGRVDGMHFDIALFTNLTRDHLDYHGSMAAYEAAKRRLFDWPGLGHAVVNLDDEAGARIASSVLERGVPLTTTSLTGRSLAGASALLATDLQATDAGLSFTVTLGERRQRVAVPLVGSFNAANLLGVIGVLLAAQMDLGDALAALPQLVPPPGRMQVVTRPGAPLAVVDYAHTPDALVQALAALQPLRAARGGRLWAVFGAGGDRDPGKRAPMGAAAVQGADRVLITSDNPRTEDPAQIASQVAQGAAGARVVLDRAAAITEALMAAAPEDVVLIAGKGHEDYQDVGGRKLPFSDVEHAELALAARAAAHEGAPC
ncbi:MAG TPA: UDP-N-acetylmuramoyl-L-alanyl-D-glutamate--2,6-diaminopimelate ligase [Burkholderiaceae bacterium]|nr:UDP-N-acetylmuramoyl-L-alanyl-D-glutamate--2,6-diaminopimelate ligase [Burkholderiaceae bacterium]